MYCTVNNLSTITLWGPSYYLLQQSTKLQGTYTVLHINKIKHEILFFVSIHSH